MLREQLDRALANIPWERAVEAQGWTLILHLAALGVGIAVVNDICKIPAGAVARRIPELTPLGYWLLHRRDLDADDPAAGLRTPIIDAFRRVNVRA